MNTSFRLCPFADILYAMDENWWKHYRPEVKRAFSGELWSAIKLPGINRARFQKHCGNSGAGAVALAAKFGAARVYLLGYDAKHTGGKTHWHGNHPTKLGNAGVVSTWPAQFAELRSWVGAEVINLSRETAITCFPRGTVEEFLA